MSLVINIPVQLFIQRSVRVAFIVSDAVLDLTDILQNLIILRGLARLGTRVVSKYLRRCDVHQIPPPNFAHQLFVGTRARLWLVVRRLLL